MASKSGEDTARRLSVIDEIKEQVLSLGAETASIQNHAQDDDLGKMTLDDLEHLAEQLDKVLFECGGIMPHLR